MKFGSIDLLNWERISSTEWARFINSTPGYLQVSVEKIYSYSGQGYAWYPFFYNDLSFLQEIYDSSTNRKEFKYNEEKEIMQYVDEFLVRINKLKVFA